MPLSFEFLVLSSQTRYFPLLFVFPLATHHLPLACILVYNNIDPQFIRGMKIATHSKASTLLKKES